jgi:hypothetical protein
MSRDSRKVEITRDVTFDENISFGKSIEDSMDSNYEEEHEGPKEETTCSPEHPNEEPVEPIIVPKTIK